MEKKHQTFLFIGYGPLPVTVPTKSTTCLVGNPYKIYKPLFATATGRGPRPTYTPLKFNMKPPNVLLETKDSSLGSHHSGQIIAITHDLTPNGCLANPLISGKSRLVKYRNLARFYPFEKKTPHKHKLSKSTHNLPQKQLGDFWGGRASVFFFPRFRHGKKCQATVSESFRNALVGANGGNGWETETSTTSLPTAHIRDH